jgi:hypothetical protein
VTDPSNAFSRLRPDSDLTSPLLFGLILSWAGFVISQSWELLFGGLVRSMFSGVEGAPFLPGTAWTVGMIALFPCSSSWVSSSRRGSLTLSSGRGATSDRRAGSEGTLKVGHPGRGLAGIVPFIGSVIAVL